MRKILLTTGALLIIFFVSAQNVGIGINPPLEKLHVDSGHIKIGSHVWSGTFYDKFLKFGDGDFVYLGETGEDDRLVLYAKNFIFTKSSNGYSGNVGIGTASAPSAKLEVNGDIKITDGTQSAGKVLTSNASGLASWQLLPLGSSANTGFSATNTAGQVITSGALPFVILDFEDYDDGGNFSSSGYTAPADGVYHFDAMVHWSTNSSGGVRYAYILKIYVGFIVLHKNVTYFVTDILENHAQTLSCDLKLTTGQTVRLSVEQNTGINKSIQAGPEYTFFSGHRVY